MSTKKKVTSTVKEKTKSSSALTVVEKANTEVAALTEEQKQLAELAVIDNDGEAWGAGADLDEQGAIYTNDYLLPKLWVMQALSEQLKVDKELEQGDIINSLTGEVVCLKGEELEFVVVRSYKRWQGFRILANGKKEYVKEFSGIMTLENANWPYEFTENGVNCRRRQVNSFIILLKKDILANNPQPYVIDFTSSSRQGGRKLITALKNLNNRDFGGKKLPSAAALFSVYTKIQDFADGSCYVKDINFKGYTNKQVLAMARTVYEDVKAHAGEIEFDDRDVLEAEVVDAKINASDIV